MTKEKYERKFWLQIGKRVIFGIIRKEVIVIKTKLIINKNEDEVE